MFSQRVFYDVRNAVGGSETGNEVRIVVRVPHITHLGIQSRIVRSTPARAVQVWSPPVSIRQDVLISPDISDHPAYR